MSYLMRKLLGGYMEGEPGQPGGAPASSPAAPAAPGSAPAAPAAPAAAPASPGSPGGVSDAEAKLLKEVMKKKEALEAAERAAAEAQAKLKEYEGIDPAEVKRLKKEKEDAEQQELIRKGEFDKIKEQMNAAHQKELDALKNVVGEKDGTIGSLQQTIADLTVGSAFANSKYREEDLTLSPSKARALYGPHFEFKDGKVIGYDKPVGAKDRAPLVDGKGEPLPFEDAFKKIVDADPDKDSITKSKVKQGAASTTTNQPGAAPASEPGTPVLRGMSKIAAGLAKQAAAKK